MLRFLPAISFVILAGCAASQPTPELGTHPRSDFTIVDYPPPAALVEVVPEAPSPEAVWVDGQWRWRGRYWVWRRGGWVNPRGLVYAPPELRYRKNGRMLYSESTWRDAAGRRVDDPPFLLPAAVPPTEETAE
jgi:hypothetical protein